MFDNKEYQRKYREANKERLKLHNDKYRKENKEELNKRARDRRIAKRLANNELVDKRAKAVVQLDYQTGEFIGRYENVKDAAHDNFIDKGGLTVSLRKRGGILERKELRFMYEEDYLAGGAHDKRRKK